MTYISVLLRGGKYEGTDNRQQANTHTHTHTHTYRISWSMFNKHKFASLGLHNTT